MLITYFVLAASVSIDSLGIGITYGFKDTKISFMAKIILFLISILITSFAVLAGKTISQFLPEIITRLLGCILLVCMGIWVIAQTFLKKEVSSIVVQPKHIKKPKVYKFFIRCFGITIQIIRDPNSSDLDHSKKIDAKEALYLGLALSIDSICVGISSGMIGFSFMFFPFLVAIFQLCFLSFGRILGSKIANSSSIPEHVWTIISGTLLIGIGLSKFFF